MWRNFAYECEDDTVAAETSRFSLKALLEDGDRYKSFIEFYRILWSSVPEELRVETNRVAAELEEHLRTRHDKKQVQFTAIDLIDCTFPELSASCDPAHEALNEPADFWAQARH